MKYLTSSNAKIIKGEKRGYMTFGLHLAPADLSGFNVCKCASDGCRAACLNTAGRGVYSKTQNTRIQKTREFFSDKGKFMTQLVKEIEGCLRKAAKKEVTPCFRLNLTSDLPWESIKYKGKSLMELFPKAIFYDYTKNPSRMTSFLTKKFPKNYHLTFSRSESNGVLCPPILRSKGTVAIVFRGGLPAKWRGFKVVDGDIDDLRFLDRKGCVVGLKQKGKAKKDLTGFVLEGGK
jgi:hypothetical protein